MAATWCPSDRAEAASSGRLQSGLEYCCPPGLLGSLMNHLLIYNIATSRLDELSPLQRNRVYRPDQCRSKQIWSILTNALGAKITQNSHSAQYS